MKFTSLLGFLAVLVLPSLSLAQTYSLTYDNLYDDFDTSLNVVACSNGVYGLETKGYTTVGSLPTWPYVGGVFAVTGWDSPACGTCWEVMYTFNGTSTMLAVLAIDTADEGFNLSQEAMDVLTGENAVELGRVNVTATQVASSVCGLS